MGLESSESKGLFQVDNTGKMKHHITLFINNVYSIYFQRFLYIITKNNMNKTIETEDQTLHCGWGKTIRLKP